jgi:SSS family transporter
LVRFALACILAGAVTARGAAERPAQVERLRGGVPALGPEYAGAVAGATGGAFVVAGLRTAVLEFARGTWQAVEPGLGRAWAAGAQGRDGIYAAGGVDANGRFSARVTRLAWDGVRVEQVELTPLPHRLAGAGAAVVGDTLYVVGGLDAPEAAAGENRLWALDLTRSRSAWRELEAMPAAGRFLPAAAGQSGGLEVFGGREVRRDGRGEPFYPATAEVWVYLPAPMEGSARGGWQRRTRLDHPLAGAVALPTGQAHTLVLGGASSPAIAAPFAAAASGGPEHIRLYHALTDAWSDTGLGLAAFAPLAAWSPKGELWVLAGSGADDGFRLRLVRRTRDLSAVDYAVIGAYFLVLAAIGWYSFRRQRPSSAEYSLGSRSVKWWAAGISMYATGASAISFMAVPALAFSTNLIWMFGAAMAVPAFFVQAYLIFPILRKLQLTSTYEYLERRFNRPLRVIASLQQILFLTFGRAAVVLVLPAIALAATTGLNVYVSVLVMGVLTTVYATMGGFKAVIWTEVFQGFLKLVAPLAMIGVAVWALPGHFGEFLRMGRAYHKFDLALLTWDATRPAVWVVMLNFFVAYTIMYAGDQPVIQRVFAAPAGEVRRVAAANVACSLVIAVVSNLLGIAIFAYFHAHPDRLDAGAPNDQIVPLFAIQALPTGLAGVVVAAIFASAMATVASNMNSVATIFTEDFYRRLRPASTDRERLRVLHIGSYVTGGLSLVTALGLATLNIESMMAVWYQAIALLGGGIVGVYSLGMLSTRANGTGAVSGALLSVAALIVIKLGTPLHWFLYTPLAIGICMAAGYLISLLFPGPPRDLTGLTVFTPRRPGGEDPVNST